ncbi:MAG: hypothetical protein GQ570_11645 [Helicobacteraceae bacterium]|nr:hypothetical protein [Helicobacteraceae bacterium]
MTISRTILHQKLNDEKLSVRIMCKAKAFNITKDVMGRDVRDWICLLVCFDLDEFIEAQEEHIKVMRKDYVEYNKELLEIMKGLR